MIDYFMLEFAQPFVRLQHVGRARNRLAVALQDAHHGGLTLPPVPVIFEARLLACVLRALPEMNSIWSESHP
jgi:hypothetical protein